MMRPLRWEWNQGLNPVGTSRRSDCARKQVQQNGRGEQEQEDDHGGKRDQCEGYQLLVDWWLRSFLRSILPLVLHCQAPLCLRSQPETPGCLETLGNPTSPGKKPRSHHVMVGIIRCGSPQTRRYPRHRIRPPSPRVRSLGGAWSARTGM